MNPKKFSILVVFSVFSWVSLWGQSNDLLDDFLSKESADVGTSLLLLAQSLNELPYEAGTEDAVAWAGSQSWWKTVQNLPPSDPLPLGRFFLVLFQSYEVNGKSLMFSLFKTPRYAAREAFSLNFCSGKPYYNRNLQPSEVLFAISMAMEASHE
jgi:hypothetical protein